MNKYINNTATQALINGFKGKFGNNSALKTTSKNFVGAINELKLAIANLPPPIQSDMNWHESNVTTGAFKDIMQTSNGTLLAASDNFSGIKYSEDDGKTWQDSNFTNYRISDIMQVGDTCVLYSDRIKYSEDGGKTWQDGKFTDNYSTSGYMPKIVTDNGIIIAYTSGSVHNSRVAYSEDGGKTWQSTSNSNDSFIKAANGTIISLNASNTAEGIRYSEDDGRTWQYSNITTDIRQFNRYIIADDGTIIISVKNKLMYSEDNGKNWQDCSGVSNKAYNSFLKLNNGTILVSINGAGIKYSEDNGKNWQSSNITAYGTDKDFIRIDDNNIIALIYIGGSYAAHSEDGGKTWQTDSSSECYNVIVINTEIVIADFANGLKYSEDSGKTWQDSNIITRHSIFSSFIYNDYIIISTYDNGIIYSKDNGKTWQNSNYINSSSYLCSSFIVINNTLVATTNDAGIIYLDLSELTD